MVSNLQSRLDEAIPEDLREVITQFTNEIIAEGLTQTLLQFLTVSDR